MDRPTATAAPKRSCLQQETILLVDDEPDILQTTARFLEKRLHHVNVLTAASGPEALAVLQHHPVTLVVSDYRMPKMDGLEFLDAVHRSHAKMPCIMTTAYSDANLAIRAVNEGKVLHFFTKPFEAEELAKVVGGLLWKTVQERARDAAAQHAVGMVDAPGVV